MLEKLSTSYFNELLKCRSRDSIKSETFPIFLITNGDQSTDIVALGHSIM